MADPISPSGGEGGVRLPDQDLGRVGRGDALAAGGGEADGVVLGEVPGPLQADGAARDEQVQERCLGQPRALARLEPGHVQAAYLLLIRMALRPSSLTMPDATGTRVPPSSSGSISSCSYPGAVPPSSGTIHIWTKCTESVCRSPWSRHESFFSE